MPEKIQKILQLASQTAHGITSGPEQWASFLNTASRLYKYPFQDQLLIYAQRPEATACAPYDIWNTRLHRWVRRGAAGIALIAETPKGMRLKYVFDVADTGGKQPLPNLWELRPEYDTAVQNVLKENYEVPENAFPACLQSAAGSAAESSCGEILPDLMKFRNNSLMEELDEENIRLLLRSTMTASVRYMLLTRCGIDAGQYITADDLRGIVNFNTVATLSCMGNSMTGIASGILRQIEHTVKQLEKQAPALENRQEQGYNDTKESFSALKRSFGMEDAANGGADIQKERGLSDSGSGDGQTAGGRTREVRQDEAEISQGAQGRNVYGTDARREAVGAPSGYRSGGGGTDGPDRQGSGEAARRDGSSESLRPDALGTGNEQHPDDGGGNRPERTDLQLNGSTEAADFKSAAFSFVSEPDGPEQLSFFPTEQEQRESAAEAEDEKSSAFSIPREDINRALRTGSGVEGGKYRINEWFQNPQHSLKESADFLKREYGTGGRSFSFSDGTGGGIWFSAKGFSVSHEKSMTDPEFRMTWESTAKQIRDLVLSGRYLTPEEQKNRTGKKAEPVPLPQPTESEIQEPAPSKPEPASPPDSNSRPVTLSEGSFTTGNGIKLHEIVLTLSGGQPDVRQGTPEHAAVPENFRITDDHLGEGGTKTKYGYNLAAIRTLKAVEAEGRTATPEEQETLSRYVGWGGIPQAFDEKNETWAKEYAELVGALTAEEYEMARSSVLNAHYTSPAVIKEIYSTLERFGFRTGNILEPAMGVGNFFGLLPESMENSRLYGVELDSITGRIAKQLYPKADVTVSGFEKTEFPDDFFDLAVGNVPFGGYQVPDRRYDRYKFQIHDYFFAKTLDKIRPGGLMVFLTSKGTMDKRNREVRRYIAQRADLLGAARLPNTAFLKNAGTQVTADILFFQKRDRPSMEEPDWIETGETADGVPVNRYFLEHPEAMLGTMVFDDRMYGNAKETTCNPREGADLEEQLREALSFVAEPNRETLTADELPDSRSEDSAEREPIPADPSVRNYSYTLVKGKLYFRENSVMNPVDLPALQLERVRGLIGLRDCTRSLIDLQMRGADDEAVHSEQERLNTLYDTFIKRYGLIDSSGNRCAFAEDSSYSLLCSLEVINENGELERKADMFTKRTIRQETVITSVDTASEALAASLSEKGRVDLGYMSGLLGNPGPEKVAEDLRGVIFKDPAFGNDPFTGWVTADEYLSGNVRQKLQTAREAAEKNPEFAGNAAALEKVQPKELTASEISIRLGANWIDPEYIDQFLYETFGTPVWMRGEKGIKTRYSPATGVWNISGKGQDSRNNIHAYTTYGTARVNAYKILEETLNLKVVRIFDQKEDADGKTHRELNAKETTLAQQKQEAIKEAFQSWVWEDPERRQALCEKYNILFNSTRPREYEGSHLTFPGMNPEIRLQPHQLSAVARGLYGRNVLLAHCVGAGKTYEMAAIAMKSKQIGLCRKSLIAVPNHLTEQWGSDFLRLYPGANILVSTKKDFEPANRRKFCARIATGDYDAVIIGHSQFEKIPVSAERQIKMIQDQIRDIEFAIEQAKEEKGENFTIKQMEKSRKSLETRMERLNDDSRKDDVVTFEELGVDRLFVDEADNYKNLFLYTKMRNVAGIGQTEAQKSSDMFMKCRYMDELTGGRGITFATGTPVSNSMTELFTMMRYLQYDALQERNLGFFDNWAATFGETVTATELAPEGTGFRAKTRFARFFNLPELMNFWKEAADIQTAGMLKLPVPEAEYVSVVTRPSEFQKEGVRKLGDRAEKIRKGSVDPSVDNMLRITGDGRLLALDQRLMNPLLPDDPESKVNACVKNIVTVWRESEPGKGAQLVFCDLSTPHGNGSFNVYGDIKGKLLAQGIPAEEIAFIHDAKTEVQKAELFAKVRKGRVRVLLGSTAKMGAGTNIQDRLIALHHLDCPWKPRDIEQREGRIIRKGNNYPKVKIFRYVTENTFDSYSWQLIENKQRFISQVMTGKSPARSCEDIDESVLSYAEVKALATGDPRMKEKMNLEIQVTKLKMLRSGFLSQHYTLEDRLLKYYPEEIQERNAVIEGLTADRNYCKEHPVPDAEHFSMTVKGMEYTDKKEAGTALIRECEKLNFKNSQAAVGEYGGFSVRLELDSFGVKFYAVLKRQASHRTELSRDAAGNVTRLNNVLKSIPQRLETEREDLELLERQEKEAKEELTKEFPQERELAEKSERLDRLSLELNVEKNPAPVPEPEEENNKEDLPSGPLSDRVQNARQAVPESDSEQTIQPMEIQ